MPRPTKPPEQRLAQRSHRLLPSHWVEFDALGGIAWLRQQLAKAVLKRRRTSEPAP